MTAFLIKSFSANYDNLEIYIQMLALADIEVERSLTN